MKTVLITGASSGIGMELAKVYGRKGYSLILAARRKYRLELLKKEIMDNISTSPEINPEITVIEKDLGEPGASLELYRLIKDKGLKVDMLINNAGFGIYGKFSGFSSEDMERNRKMTDLNIWAVVELTKLYLDEFLERKEGAILNVASVAAFLPGPMMANYYASKAYVLSFTEAVREEVKGTGIKIGTLCPGPTATEFEKSSNADNGGLFSTMKVMTAEKVAKIAYRDFMKGKSIIVPGLLNKMAIFMVRFLPGRLLTAISGKIQEKKINRIQ